MASAWKYFEMRKLKKRILIFLVIASTLIIAIVLSVKKAPDAIRVACVGDSITYGHGIRARLMFAYPQKLNRRLGRNYIVKNFGNSGSTLLKKGNKPYWEQPEFQASMAFQPDIVIILLGTNDAKAVNWLSHKDEFKSDYLGLIRTYRQLSSTPKIVVGIPLPVFTAPNAPNGIKKEYLEQEIIQIIQGIAEDQHLPTIDFYTAFRNKPDYLPDRVHPNRKGAELMAQEAEKAIRKIKWK